MSPTPDPDARPPHDPTDVPPFPPSTGGREPTRLIANQDTMEDYSETFIPPLATQVEGRFAVVQDPTGGLGEPEVLSLSREGRLVHYHHDPDSQSGWTRDEVPVPASETADPKILRLTAFYRGDALWVFLQYEPETEEEIGEESAHLVGSVGRTVVMVRPAAGPWRLFKTTGQLANVLRRVRQLGVHLDASGNRFLFGITHSFSPAQFFLVGEADGEAAWELSWLKRVEKNDSAFHLLAGYRPGKLMVVRSSGSAVHFQEGVIRGGEFEPRGDEECFDLGGGTLCPDQIVPFPARPAGGDSVHFLFRSDRKNLYHVVLRPAGGSTKDPLSAHDGSPSGLGPVALSVDSEKRYTALVLDEHQSLWLIRQKAGKGLEFEPHWTHQGDRLRVIGAPVAFSRGPEFFAVDMRHRLVHTQQPRDGLADGWHSRVVAVPSSPGETPCRGTSHTLELTCEDDAGVRVPNRVIHLAADRHTTVHANGFSYVVGPSRQVPVKADMAGQLVVRLPTARGVTHNSAGPDGGYADAPESDDLTAPRIIATVRRGGGLPPLKAEFAPDLALYKRMADESQMTGKRLRESPLVDPNRIDGGTAAALAAMCRQAAAKRLRPERHQDPEVAALCAEPLSSKRWQLEFRDGGVDIHEQSGEDFATAWAAAGEEALRTPSFGDFFRWISNTAKAFARAVIEITERAFRLIVDGVRFVLEIGEQIGQFLEGLFKRLAEAFEKVIDAAGALLAMFEALFSWQDILVTKRVLHAAFDGLTSSLEASLRDDVPAFLEKQFAAARQEVNRRFDDARRTVGGQSMAAVAGHAKLPTNPFVDQSYAKQQRSHEVRGRYVQQLATNALARIPGEALQPTPEQEARYSDLVTRLRAIFEKAGLQGSADEIGKDLAELAADPSKLFQLGISALLTILEALTQVALTVAEELLSLLLKSLAGILGEFRKLLKKVIPIPVLSALYRQWVGSDLTLLDLACLALATPATILFKVFRGGKAPFAEKDVDEVRRAMARWGDLRRVIRGPSRDEAEDLPDTEALETVFSICGACLMLVAVPAAGFDDAFAMAEANIGALPIFFTAMSGLGMALAWPMSVADLPFEKRKVSDHLALGTWIADLAWFGFNALVSGLIPTKKTNWVPWVGPVLCCIGGVVRFITAIVEVAVHIVEGSAKGILGGVQNLVAGFEDVCRLAIPLASRGGKVGAAAALLVFGVGQAGGGVRQVLTFVSLGVPNGTAPTGGG